MSKLTFIYEDTNANLIKEFDVKEGATTEEILEAFAAFLVLCGIAHDDGSYN